MGAKKNPRARFPISFSTCPWCGDAGTLFQRSGRSWALYQTAASPPSPLTQESCLYWYGVLLFVTGSTDSLTEQCVAFWERVCSSFPSYSSIFQYYCKCSLFLFQDQELEELKQQVSTLKSQNEQLQVTVTQQVSQIQQHKDQYNLLKVQLGMLQEE